MSQMGRREERALRATSLKTGEGSGHARSSGSVKNREVRTIQYPAGREALGGKRSKVSLSGTEGLVKKRSVATRRNVVADMILGVEPPGKRARKGGITALEAKSISEEQQSQYSFYLQRFKDFCKENKLPWPIRAKADETLADYFDVLYLEGKGVNYGEKTLAAVEFYSQGLKGKMVRSRRALRGWRKLVPPRSRLPLPKMVAYGVAMRLLFQGEREAALLVLLSFDTYLRPGEALDLLKKNLVQPVAGAGTQYRHYTVVVREEEEGRPDKTGVYSSSIRLDNPSTEKWLGVAVQNHVKGKKLTDAIFNINPSRYREVFKSAGRWLGLQDLCTYQLRHGGASEDLAGKVRDYQGVKDRGRWMTDSSVRRYAKVGKLQSLLNRMPAWALEYCRRSLQKMPEVMRGRSQPISL